MCAPKLSKEAAEKITNHFVEVRGKIRDAARYDNIKSAIPITVRSNNLIKDKWKQLLEFQNLWQKSHYLLLFWKLMWMKPFVCCGI